MNKPVRTRLFLLLVLVCILGVMVAVVQSQDDDLPLYALPGANAPVFSSGSLALSPDGRTAVTANMLNGTASLINLRASASLEVTTGADPRSVAITPDQTRALVVNRGDGTLSVVDIVLETPEALPELLANYPVGVMPYAVVTDNDTSAYVSVESPAEIVQVDLASGDILSRVSVPEHPAAMTIWGDFLYITHLWSGDVSMVYLPQMVLVRTVSTGRDVTLSQSLTINTRDGLAYLAQTRSYAQNTALTFDTTVFPLVNVLDLATLSLQPSRRVTLDTADRPVNMPFDSALEAQRNYLYVVNAGSDDLSVIDLTTGLAVAHINVGSNPRGVRLSNDGAVAYIHNMIDGSLSVVNTRSFALTVVPVSTLVVPAGVFFGAQLFHSANPQMSRDQWVSCANCHFDGLSDGRVWQGFTENTTPSLQAFTWTGDWTQLRYLEAKIRSLQGGQGLIDLPLLPETEAPDTNLLRDMESLSTYLQSLNATAQTP